MSNREWRRPHLVKGSGDLFTPSTKNFANGKIHTYWFPKQYVQDQDDPTYQSPPATFPAAFNIFAHPKIVRILSDEGQDTDGSPGGGGSGANDVTFSWSVTSIGDGTTTNSPPTDDITKPNGFIFGTGSSTDSGGTIFNGLPPLPGGMVTTYADDPESGAQSQADIKVALVDAMSAFFTLGITLLYSVSTTPIAPSSGGSNTNNWGVGINNITLQGINGTGNGNGQNGSPFLTFQLMNHDKWVQDVAPCMGETPFSFYGPNVLNIRIFSELDGGIYTDGVLNTDEGFLIQACYDTWYYYHTMVILDAQCKDPDDPTPFDDFNAELTQVCNDLRDNGFEYVGIVDSLAVNPLEYLTNLINTYFQNLNPKYDPNS